MVPCSFDQSNEVLGAPDELGVDGCDALSVLRTKTESGETIVLSCWKLTKEEVEELNRTGRLWLYVWGFTMPPVAMTCSNPFKT